MSPHVFLPRFRNILVSHQAVPLTFYNKTALMVTVNMFPAICFFYKYSSNNVIDSLRTPNLS